MDGGAWWAAVHGVAESWTRLSDFTFSFHLHALEKEMATHSSVLAWRIPGTGEPGGLPSMGSLRVGHDWSDSAAVWVNVYFFSPPEVVWGVQVAQLTGMGASQAGDHTLFLGWGAATAGWIQIVLPLRDKSDLMVTSATKGMYDVNEQGLNSAIFLLLFLFVLPRIQGLGLPCWFSGKDSALLRQVVWVWSLVRELDPTCHN